jgi:archaellum component FlaG (FlaF/FlaG flagellin family)
MKKGLFYFCIILIIFASCDKELLDDSGKVEEEVSLTIDPKAATVLRGQTSSTFTLTIKGTNNKAVTWSIEEEGKHEGTEFDTENKRLVVDSNETLTTLTLRVTLDEDPDVSAVAAIDVPVPEITGLCIETLSSTVFSWFTGPKKLDVDKGMIENLIAAVSCNYDYLEAVEWEIITNVDLKPGTVIENGQLTIDKDETYETKFMVRAASTVEPEFFDSVEITVRKPQITGLDILAFPALVEAGKSVEIAATVYGSGQVPRQVIKWELVRKEFDGGDYSYGTSPGDLPAPKEKINKNTKIEPISGNRYKFITDKMEWPGIIKVLAEIEENPVSGDFLEITVVSVNNISIGPLPLSSE